MLDIGKMKKLNCSNAKMLPAMMLQSVKTCRTHNAVARRRKQTVKLDTHVLVCCNAILPSIIFPEPETNADNGCI